MLPLKMRQQEPKSIKTFQWITLTAQPVINIRISHVKFGTVSLFVRQGLASISYSCGNLHVISVTILGLSSPRRKISTNLDHFALLFVSLVENIT